MSNRLYSAQLVKRGESLSQISSELGISVGTVVNYLRTHVGEGTIRRSDIYFAIDADTREILDLITAKFGELTSKEIAKIAKEINYHVDVAEIEVYLQFRDARVSMGDMYEFIAEIETGLHKVIKRILIDAYGPDETGWWRKGIPTEIRQECQAMREADPEPAAEPFSYTTFMQLGKIIDKQWEVFSKTLPEDAVKNKKSFLSNLAKLNYIRNGVMHPVKGIVFSGEDFALVREFKDAVQPDKWRFVSVSSA